MKKTFLWLLLDAVFLVLFNTFFFLLGGSDHPASVWISYGFIHFAYIMVIATPILTRKNRSTTVLRMPLYTISTVYFLVEFVVGLIFIFIASDTVKATLLSQILIAGIYAIFLLINLIANESTSKNVERQKQEVDYIKTASSRIMLFVDKASDKKANKAIERAYDMLHSSPTRSNEDVKSIETDILNKISELETAVRADETEKIIKISDDIVSLLENRNRKVRLSN